MAVEEVVRCPECGSQRIWKDLELEVLDLLTSLGYEAERNVRIKGARGKHQVDVAARFEFGGFCYLIIVECKYWNKKVDKSRVATLSNIANDIGANKGIIISIKGFQKGAFDLARNSNIELRFRKQVCTYHPREGWQPQNAENQQ